MERYLKVKFSNGDIFTIPARVIAENRAEYYSSIDGYDKDSNEWEAEIQYALHDNYEIYDWAGNNMNWSDLEPYAKKIEESDFNHEDNWGDAEKEYM